MLPLLFLVVQPLSCQLHRAGSGRSWSQQKLFPNLGSPGLGSTRSAGKGSFLLDPILHQRCDRTSFSSFRPVVSRDLRIALIRARHRWRLHSDERRREEHRVYAVSNGALNASDASVSTLKGGGGGPLQALRKFTRPHTVRGTVLAFSAAVVRTLLTTGTAAIHIGIVVKSILGVIVLLFANNFCVGINQIYDKDVDKINKPFLPVAAGEMSTRRAWSVVMISLAAGLVIVHLNFSPLIAWLYTSGLILGGVYSVPPLQLKRFPLAAAGIIAVIRGFMLNIWIFAFVNEAFLQTFEWDPSVLFISRFMTIFASMIAVTKDLPDVVGDKKYGIKTFANTYGVAKVATGAVAILGLNYVTAIAEGIVRGGAVFRPAFMIGGHLVALVYLLWIRSELQSKDVSSTKLFYRRIWNLFYFEYVLYALI